MAKSHNLYLIRIYNNNENFFKIGTSVHKYCRFYQIMKFGYKVDIVFMLLGVEFNKSLEYERLLQSEFYENHYLPNIKFGGYTECFSEIDIDRYKRITDVLEYKTTIENYSLLYRYKCLRDL